MKRVLVCEDEKAIREFVVINLERQGYTVTEAASGEQALQKFNAASFDVALLDVMLPGMDGFAVCQAIRERTNDIGIIMLTARSQESDKVTGLSIGADDYITKPFSPSELVARVDALYRRVKRSREGGYSEELRSGAFVLNVRNHTLSGPDLLLELTQVEFQVMELFFKNPGKALSREDILLKVWGDEYFGEIKTVDVNIRRLRMKIESDPSQPRHIITVWGMGYKWMG